MKTPARVGELYVHPDAVAGPADAALDHVAGPELPPDPRRMEKVSIRTGKRLSGRLCQPGEMSPVVRSKDAR